MKLIIGIILLLPVMVFPQTDKISVPYTQHVLKNGLNVLIHEDHTTPTASVNVWYHVGSGNEKPGRTGFAHLFEHIMFEGSGNVPEGKFDEWLESAGANNNGSTNTDRTNYYEDLPNNVLDLALFLESDRMGHLLDAMSPAKVDGQRDVVKNERRQSYENQPYGFAWEIISKNLYPENYPYHWQTIGSMKDLSAASYEDVVEFFKKYYVPNNASLSIAGDVNTKEVIEKVEHWFSEIPAGDPVTPIDPPSGILTSEKRIILEDKVQLPRIYMVWQTPAQFTPGDAEFDVLANIFAGGKNSRLYQKLVYDLQIAQDVSVFQSSAKLNSEFYIIATARSGHDLNELEKLIQEEIEKIKTTPSDLRELERAVNQFESAFLDRLESPGGFSGKANSLNQYYFYTGNPDYFNEDLARYKALSVNDIQAMAKKYLSDNARVVLSVVPEGKTDLAASDSIPAEKEIN